MKQLSLYINVIQDFIVSKFITELVPIGNIVNNSSKIIPGDLFVAIKGSVSDGHNYIDDAISRGAQTIIHTAAVTHHPAINYIQVTDIYRVYALLSEFFYDYPSKNFNLCGVTGTNGKTTTAFLLKSLLQSSNRFCGLISTVEYSCGEEVQVASRTTPEANDLQLLFTSMANAGCRDVVMEVSSHGLDQNRTASAEFRVGIFTNLSGDHLDYHGNMEQYFKVKKLLFTEALAANGTAIINIDDSYGSRIANELTVSMLTYGRHDGSDCRIKCIKSSINETQIDLEIGGKNLTLFSSLIGDYNAYNITATALAAYSLGIDLTLIREHFCRGAVHNVPGRLEMFHSLNGVTVFVDYAHTDDALKNVLETLKPLTEGRLIVVFGCGGDRDVTKRHRMGEVASLLADIVVITSDNPRTENPQEIIRQIQCGVTKSSSTRVVEDRKLAITEAIRIAKAGDVVLVAGKGHEAYQEVNGVFHDSDDRVIVAALCQA